MLHMYKKAGVHKTFHVSLISYSSFSNKNFIPLS